MLSNKIIKRGMVILVLGLSFTACKRDNAKISTKNELTDATQAPTQQTMGIQEPNEKREGNLSNQAQEEIKKDMLETEGGGNEYNTSSAAKVYEIRVLVSEKSYYYNNAPISLEALISKIAGVDGEVIVFITDDNATQRDYKRLVDRLNELEIPFVEE